ncbi:hypothetical protein ACFJYA_08830 [Enterococcus faecalis]
MEEKKQSETISLIEETQKYVLSLMSGEYKSPEMVAAIAELLKVLRDWD